MIFFLCRHPNLGRGKWQSTLAGVNSYPRSAVRRSRGPLAARAQQSSLPRIGYLGIGTADGDPQLLPGFFQGLAETGYIPDQNVGIVYRWADGDYRRLPNLAAELVKDRVDVIVTFAAFPTALAAKAATTTIPIVFMIGGDPIAGELVESVSTIQAETLPVSLLPQAK